MSYVLKYFILFIANLYRTNNQIRESKHRYNDTRFGMLFGRKKNLSRWPKICFLVITVVVNHHGRAGKTK